MERDFCFVTKAQKMMNRKGSNFVVCLLTSCSALELLVPVD